MCFDPITIGSVTISAKAIAMAAVAAALSAATAGTAGYLNVKGQNEAAIHQYKYQQQQQALINNAAMEQYQEALSRQRLDAQRQGQQALEGTQTNILEAQRRQAAAQANAATAGITGMPLDMLFNEFQISVGNVASNLETQYQQITENMFFGADNARREAQSRINQATPAPPYLAKFNPAPALLQGATAGFNTLSSSLLSNPAKTDHKGEPPPPPPETSLPQPNTGQSSSFLYQGWRYS